MNHEIQSLSRDIPDQHLSRHFLPEGYVLAPLMFTQFEGQEGIQVFEPEREPDIDRPQR